MSERGVSCTIKGPDSCPVCRDYPTKPLRHIIVVVKIDALFAAFSRSLDMSSRPFVTFSKPPGQKVRASYHARDPWKRNGCLFCAISSVYFHCEIAMKMAYLPSVNAATPFTMLSRPLPYQVRPNPMRLSSSKMLPKPFYDALKTLCEVLQASPVSSQALLGEIDAMHDELSRHARHG